MIAVIGGVAIIGGILMVPVVGHAYASGVNRIVLKGDVYQQSDPAKALVYYQAADYISGATPELVVRQVKTLNALSQFDAAARQINRLQRITPEIRMIRARIALEKGSDVERNLAIVLTAPDGATPLMSINSNQTALAAELLARGLVRSSQRVIVAIPEGNRSAQDYLILAKSQIRQSDNQGAKAALEASLKLDITNLETHKLYLVVLESLGEDTAKQQEVIGRLEAGKI